MPWSIKSFPNLPTGPNKRRRTLPRVVVIIVVSCRGTSYLSLDGVLAPEHIVNVLEVVRAGGDGRNITLGGEVLLEVGLVPELAHLGLLAQPNSYTIQ